MPKKEMIGWHRPDMGGKDSLSRHLTIVFAFRGGLSDGNDRTLVESKRHAFQLPKGKAM